MPLAPSAPHAGSNALRTAALRAAALLALLAVHGGCATRGEEEFERLLPRPQDGTLNWMEEEEEEAGHEERARWFEEMHRAAPGTDWRVVEAANAEQQRRKRNQLASMDAVSSRWSEVGSRNQAGRTHAAMRAPDGQSLYVGSALGGVWHGGLDGQDWTPIGDNIYGGGHFLAVLPGALPADPDAVLRATEDGQVHVTRDGGATWAAPTGLATVNAIRRALVRADGSHRVFLVARYVETLGGTKWGLYRSTDGMLSFQRVLVLGTAPGDAWISRSGPSPLYVLTATKLRVSSNDGDSFTDAGNLPVTAQSGELAGSEAGAPRFWAILESGGGRTLWRSDSAGTTGSWTSVASISDYWIGSLCASITNADLFAFGGVEVHRTADAGANFAIVNGWGEYYANPAAKLHADINGLDVEPDGAGGELWYVNTDGGTYRSTDGLLTVQNLCLIGLRVSQYYTSLTSSINPLHVVAGAQDQGYQRASVASSDPGGTLLDFAQLISGDYGHAVSGDGTHAFVYSVYPGFILAHKGENNPQLSQVNFPSSESYSWLPFLAADPLSNQRFFFCASHLYRYVKTGPSTWASSQWSTQDFAANGGEHLAALAFSPLDVQHAYGVTDWGRFFHSTDQGITWAQGTGSAPAPQYLYGQAIVASNQDANTAWVGGSGYSNPAVWRTTDGGATWQPWGDGLPATLVYCLGQAADGSGALFAGTERGCYRREPDAAAWVDITSNEAPVTVYWSVESVPSSNAMRFATYGRGIWDYSLTDPCSYEAYGVALGGSNTVVLDSGSTTHIGSTHVLDISNAPPLQAGTLLYAPSPASLPFKGGTLLVAPQLMLQIPVATDVAGAVSLPLAIPGNAALVNLPLNFQAVFKIGASGSWALSNGLSATLCP